MELLSLYGLFLAKVLTIVVFIAALVILAVGATQRKRQRKGELQVVNLGEQYRDMQREMRMAYLGDAERKLLSKQEKKKEKARAKQEKRRARRGEEKAPNPACTCWISTAAWTPAK